MPLTPETWLAEFTANTTTTSTQYEPRITQLSNGNVLIAWTSTATTGAASAAGTDIIGQLYDAFGNAIGSETVLNGFQVDDERDFDIAATSAGGFVVVYEDDSGDDTNQTIRASEWSSTLTGLGSNTANRTIATSTDTGDIVRTPTVTAGSDGSYTVGYEHFDTSASNYRLDFVNVTNAGVVGTAVTAVSGSTSGSSQVDSARLTNGDVVFVYDYDGSSGDDAIAYSVRNPVTGASTTGGSFVAGTNTNGDVDTNASVVALTGGGFVIAWQNFDTDTDIEMQRYNNAGVAQGGIILVDTGEGTDSNNEIEMVALADGGFLVLWDDDNDGDDTFAGRAQRYSSTGVAVGSEVVFDSSNANHTEAVLLDDGRVQLVWANGEISSLILDVRDNVNSTVGTSGIQTGTIGSDVFTASLGNGVVNAWDGNDTVESAGGIREYYLGEGNDRINVNSVINADEFYGGNGTDTIDWSDSGESGISINLAAGTASNGTSTETMEGFERAYGTAGDDAITGTSGSNYLYGGAGSDSLYADAGTDFLYGGNGSDRFYGGAGSNYMYGGAGGDYGYGGSGYDYMSGGAGIDTFYGGASGDLAYGGADNDIIYGGTGNDTAYGGDGTDYLSGSSDNDTLYGGADNDTVYTGSGDDAGYGDAGNDTLWGDTGTDELYGGDDDDLFYVTTGGASSATLSGDAGTDTVTVLYGGNDGWTVDASGVGLYGGATSHTFTMSSIENFEGSNGNDVLNEGSSLNSIDGAGGDDIIISNGGASAADSFFGGTGVDTLDDSASSVNRTLDLTTGAFSGHGGAFQFENAIMGSGDDSVTGTTDNNNIVTGAGEDIIVGGNGSDSLYGGNGADSLFGGNGDDIMDGGNGLDFLAGWNGTDIMHGRAGQDHLRGQAGEDSLVGGEGQDRLEGGGEADLLLGGNGQDKLFGGNGRDVLNGGVGNDLYNGGVGSDTFVFSGNFGDDRVQDFDATDNAEDIDLSAVASITNWTDLSTAANGHMYTAGGDVIIDDLGGNTIRLVGVNIADLNANDFLF
ncbi:MAG: hypothetical protein ACSHWY_00115 [Octadecabacter sp.]